MPKVSIIITAYNAKKTIERCLNSILETDYDDYEIILINDGSKDKTEEVVQLFASDKIKYYYKENTGVADSRNVGIMQAKGDYIAFVDSDDYVSNNYFEEIDKYINDGVDIIKRKGIIKKETDLPNENQTDYKDKTEKNHNSEVNGEVKITGAVFDETSGEDAFNKLCFTDVYLDTLWSYIFKRDLFIKNNFVFDKNKYHEDFALIPLLILKADKVVSLNKYVYYYCQTVGSIMREDNYEKTIKKAEDVLYHFDNIIKKAESYNLQKRTVENVRIYCTNAILLKVKELHGKEQEWYIRELKKRKIYKNIKARNLKQLLKKIILFINIKWYAS